MQSLKDEMEDLAFQNLHPEAYESITSRLSFLTEKGEKEMEEVIATLKKDLADWNRFLILWLFVLSWTRLRSVIRFWVLCTPNTP